jgi:hypothetical protein
VSFSISYFEHHPQVPGWHFDTRAGDAPEGATQDFPVDDAILRRHAALVAPRNARLWLARGAAIAAAVKGAGAHLFAEK